MKKIYQQKNVLEAFYDRLEFIFQEFQNIYIAFSGGKDSGVLLNLFIKYVEDHNIHRPIGIFHQDFEAQYQATSDYVESTFRSLPDYFEKFWCCLPFKVRNAMSQNNPFWYPWDPDLKDLWVRPLPEYPYIYTEDNSPFFERGMDDPQMRNSFSRWYHSQRSGKTICLLGVRADESLSRYNAIINKRHAYHGQKWIAKKYKDIWTANPLYDWTVEDIWTANAKFGFPYNPLYDLFYKAGVPLNEMRVASPFHEWAGPALHIYRIVEPKTWGKVVSRVNGANFGSIYGGTKAMAYKDIKLPGGHTWESYTRFLLSTLPPDIRDHYVKRFQTSKEFQETSNNAKGAPSWKQMCVCILKNDYNGRFKGRSTSRDEHKINEIKKKYLAIARGR